MSHHGWFVAGHSPARICMPEAVLPRPMIMRSTEFVCIAAVNVNRIERQDCVTPATEPEDIGPARSNTRGQKLGRSRARSDTDELVRCALGEASPTQ